MKTPTLVHVAAGAWIVAMGLYGVLAPDQYRMLLQEDRIVEWATVWLFLIAGAAGLVRSARTHSLFDGLVALFCVFVAGEEFSWGQRLLGYYPAEFFLAHNFQQEANVHNLPQTFLQPKWVLMMALGGYGILLPLLAPRPRARRLFSHIGATAPPPGLVPWFIAAIMLLLWYPLTLTGEWVEALAGGLFLISSGAFAATWWIMLALAVVSAGATMSVAGSLERGRDASRLACAQQEVRSLTDDIAAGSAGTDDLWAMRRVHKRVWASGGEGYLQVHNLRPFDSQQCAEATGESAGLRHQYGIDPWGSPYWLIVERIAEDERRVTVYSFGPNRRRDLPDVVTPDAELGDDVVAAAIRRVDRE